MGWHQASSCCFWNMSEPCNLFFFPFMFRQCRWVTLCMVCIVLESFGLCAYRQNQIQYGLTKNYFFKETEIENLEESQNWTEGFILGIETEGFSKKKKVGTQDWRFS